MSETGAFRIAGLKADVALELGAWEPNGGRLREVAVQCRPGTVRVDLVLEQAQPLALITRTVPARGGHDELQL